MDGDRDLKQDTYRDHGSDGDPDPSLDFDLDPDPIPNIVLHPGDALILDTHDDRHASFRLLDRHDACYAVLLCDRSGAHYWTVHAIRYVADRGRGVLPVRADSDPQPEPEPDPHGLTVYDLGTVPVTTTAGGTVSIVGPLNGPYEYAVDHYHHHSHGTGDGDVLTHAHQHQHAGPDARRANDLGHTADVHVHQH